MEPVLYKFVRPIITFLFRIFYRPVIIGAEFIPKEKRVVLAGNHMNNLDCILLMASTKRVIHFLAKDELLKGFKGVIFRNMGIIPVNRRIHDKNALKSAKEVLCQDKIIGIFPEGTFNRSDNLILPFKIGAVKMCYDTSSLLVPFVIRGEYKLLRRKICIEFYPGYYVKGDDLELENNKLMSKVEDGLTKGRNL